MNCIECGAPVFADDIHAELVCSGCSLVVQESMIDASPVPPAPDARPGVRGLKPESRRRMARLAKIDSRVVSSGERSDRRLRAAVRDLARRLGALPAVEDRAFALARRALGAGLFRGWDFGLVAGGAAHYALVESEGWVNLKEFLPCVRASHERTKRANVHVAHRAIKRLLGPDLLVASATEIARGVAARLGLPGEAVRMLDANLATLPASAVPRIDAAAALYLSCTQAGADVSQKRIAEACGTNDVSLRSRLTAFKYL